MPNFASVTLVGHLGKDPVTRQTNGDSVTNFSVATNRKRRDQPPITTWWRAACWGKRGDAIARHLKQGDPILVTGEPLLRPWLDQDGIQRFSLDVEVSDWAFVGGKEPGAAGAMPDAPPEPGSYDHDIPF